MAFKLIYVMHTNATTIHMIHYSFIHSFIHSFCGACANMGVNLKFSCSHGFVVFACTWKCGQRSRCTHTMRMRTSVPVVVCVARKLRPCPSYSGCRDRNNSIHWRSLYKGWAGYIHFIAFFFIKKHVWIFFALCHMSVGWGGATKPCGRQREGRETPGGVTTLSGQASRWSSWGWNLNGQQRGRTQGFLRDMMLLSLCFPPFTFPWVLVLPLVLSFRPHILLLTASFLAVMRPYHLHYPLPAVIHRAVLLGHLVLALKATCFRCASPPFPLSMVVRVVWVPERARCLAKARPPMPAPSLLGLLMGRNIRRNHARSSPRLNSLAIHHRTKNFPHTRSISRVPYPRCSAVHAIFCTPALSCLIVEHSLCALMNCLLSTPNH